MPGSTFSYTEWREAAACAPLMRMVMTVTAMMMVAFGQNSQKVDGLLGL